MSESADVQEAKDAELAGHPTTTHAGWGDGSPRLVVTRDEERLEFPIRGDLVRIGSGPDADLRLEGARDRHAEIRHDERDEYVLVPLGPVETGVVPEPIETLGGTPGELLRAGAHVVIGGWRLVFLRDEFADHGRPYGGRQGGEGAIQLPQPPRPDYAAEGHGEAR